MGVSIETLMGSLRRNHESGDSSATRLFKKIEMFINFDAFGCVMQDKYEETFGLIIGENNPS